MSKESSDHHKKHYKNHPEKPEDEKLFNFDKSFPEDPEGQDSNEESSEGNIAALNATIGEMKEKNLRLLAEFENYKKRTVRERLELLSSASKDLILSLLPVLDDFERAIKHANESADETISEGIRLVYNRLNNILQSEGLKAMEGKGETFDPELHEAIAEVPAPDESLQGKVLDVIEKGYMLNDKIIRHAKVVVGK
ncbi:MAG TPA: nucleotide exchange factor GrpE [Saprospiraceae bacterium]|nr:nucleotide exchange factor GrpE [Saprospiraceae bacterium]